jgi:hypothetical protein
MNIDYNLVRWVLENYHDLSRGIWPDPKVGENLSRQKQVSVHALYESPSGLAGDIAARVYHCGIDGLLAERRYGLDITIFGNVDVKSVQMRPGALARKYHMDFDAVVAALNRVCWWCTDAEYGKGLKYEEWKRSIHGHSRFRDTAGVGILDK